MQTNTRVSVAFEAWLVDRTSTNAGAKRLARKTLQRFFIVSSKAEKEAFKALVAEAEQIRA